MICILILRMTVLQEVWYRNKKREDTLNAAQCIKMLPRPTAQQEDFMTTPAMR